jgi:dienelactone hydrolase
VTDVVLFHHIQGLTPGVVAFADRLRAAGHTVHTPDLLEGRTFPTIEEGEAHVRALGFDTVFARGVAAAELLPAEAVYAGISLGVGPAQQLAQNRPGARGALILAAFIDPSEFGSWP